MNNNGTIASMQAPAHIYDPSTTEDIYLSRYPYYNGSYVDEDVLYEAHGELVTSVAEAVQCDEYEEFLLWPPALDNDATSTTTTILEATSLMAQMVRFVLRCVWSGLVLDAEPAAITTRTNFKPPQAIVTSYKADDMADDKADGNHNACQIPAKVSQEDEPHDEAGELPPSFKLFPRSVGRPSQEWTMVSTSPRGGRNNSWACGSAGPGSAASRVQLINMTTMQRLVSSQDPEQPAVRSHLHLMTPRQYREAMEKEGSGGGGEGWVRCVDAAWTLSSEGTILSSLSGLALTDDGNGNLTLRPPSSQAIRIDQQWQLIPIV